MATGRRRIYGSAHKNMKKRLLRELQRAPGQPCPRCGWPMWPGQNLHLDHNDASDGYLGLSHAACNLRAGQAITAAILRARNGQSPARSQRPARRRQARETAETATWASARRW
jgi:hypothetical protein